MRSKLIFVGMVAVAGVLPFAVSAPGSTHQVAECFGSAATLSGSGTIDGTMGDDVIVGSDGNDSIHGKGGNDKVCGGAGDDKLGGGPGDDQVDGGPGNDDLDGGPGRDTLVGGEGDDHIQCGTDEDTADGGPGSNTIVTTGFEACETVTNGGEAATAITPKQLAATLKGPRGAAGSFNGKLTPTGTGATLVWRLTFSRLSGAAVSAHLHRGGPGRAGPVIARLCSPCRSGAQRTTAVNGQPARNAILSGEAYIDVHTAKSPAGEIRGQLRRLDK